tara:strand:- start:323 stop:733 length:411 start_codon:yes stop_codon:yes gene_type:complete
MENNDSMMEAIAESNQRQDLYDRQLSFAVNFVRFNKNNPKVFHKIVELADRQRRIRNHYSIEIIMNVVRYHTDLDGKGDPFKVNNNYKAYYARMYMEYRKCPDFFETRSPSLADDYDYVPDIDYYEDWLDEQETNK